MKQNFTQLRLWAVMLMLMSVGMAHGQTVYLGDANGDGVIDITDVTTTTSIILGKTTPLRVKTANSFIRTRNFTGSYDGKNYSFGYEYVDLNLPSGLLWATCNVGADNPEDYGLFFAWGDTTGDMSGVERLFEWNNYQFGSSNALSKYCTNSSNGTVDNLTTLEYSDDAATVNWGGSWRMPTSTEWQELIDNCTWVQTTMYGVKGFKVTGTNNNSIFLSASGDWEGEGVWGSNDYGYYWSSSLDADSNGDAYILYYRLTTNESAKTDTYERDFGMPVRPVVSANAVDGKPVPTCTFSTESKTLYLGQSYTQNATSSSKGEVTYTSSNTLVATVNATTGEVTAVGAGTTIITATVAETTDNAATTATYTITVSITIGNQGGYDYVDLGLPSGLLWATCNVGATNPEDYGLFFAWGETMGQEGPNIYTRYDDEGGDYKYYDYYSTKKYTKYVTNSVWGTVDNLTTLESSDDAATVNWGGLWRMPTATEWQEVIDNCDMTETTLNDISGIILTSKNTGNSIFIPASGYCSNGKIESRGNECYCWTSSLDNGDDEKAQAIWHEMTADNICLESDLRFCGMPVRPVLAMTAPYCAFKCQTYELKIGETFSQPLATTNSGTVVYSSSDPSVATVDSEGNVTAIGTGTTTIIGSVPATGSYAAASASWTLTVVKAAPVCAFATELNLNETFQLSLSTNSTGDVSYYSEDTSVATVDENGLVKAKNDGTTIITATVASTDKYTVGTAQFIIKVVTNVDPGSGYTDEQYSKKGNVNFEFDDEK